MLLIKQVHVLLAYVTIAGFSIRGLLSIFGAAMLRQRWIRIAPHVIDTVLLACGVTLAVQLHVDPREQGWLAAKLLGLLGYIGFGIGAMRARSRPAKAACYLAALFSVAYIVRVAITRQVVPF